MDVRPSHVADLGSKTPILNSKSGIYHKQKSDCNFFENKSRVIQNIIFYTKPRKKNIENSNWKVKNKFENLKIWEYEG